MRKLGVSSLGEREAEWRASCFYNSLEEGWSEVGVSLAPQVTSRRNGLKLHQRDFRTLGWPLAKISSLRACQSLKIDCQGKQWDPHPWRELEDV